MIMVQDLPWRWIFGGTALPVVEGKTTPKWLKLMKAHDRGTDAQQTWGLACTLAGFSYSGIINCLLEDLSFSPSLLMLQPRRGGREETAVKRVEN